jgi:predicted GNAT family acetyltransferase
MMVSKSAVNEILRIITQQHKSVFKLPMNGADKTSLITAYNKSFEDATLYYKQNEDGKIAYFFRIKTNIKTEAGEDVLYVSHCFSDRNPKNRKLLFSSINEEAKNARKKFNIRKMAVCVYHDDVKLKNYFEKKGKLTAVELVGKTQYGLKILAKNQLTTKSIKIMNLKSKDINPLAKLERCSHLNEPTSRMREMFAGPKALKMITSFYKRLLKEKSCFVITKNNKLAGSISYLVKKDSNIGFVSSIFVADEFKGQGLSKLLYQKLLEEFSNRNFPNYIGSTTTDKVISLGKQLKRKEYRSVYIVKI